jgi:hypothetical protein
VREEKWRKVSSLFLPHEKKKQDEECVASFNEIKGGSLL